MLSFGCEALEPESKLLLPERKLLVAERRLLIPEGEKEPVNNKKEANSKIG
jgi:hypothetical protein